MFAIIIPFYQVTPSILMRALESVFSQTISDWEVIVIDDESPIRAEDEIALLPVAYRNRIHIKRIKNGGPGHARNVGLDMAAGMAHIDKVAFLDSDDRWDPSHLERAALALAQGDIYFCDYVWPNATTTRFRQLQLDVRAFSVGIGDGLIRRFDGDFAELILKEWPVCLSATCIRKDISLNVRFDNRFKFSSEDQHYFLTLATRNITVFYDCQAGLHLDHGLHFYSDRKRGDLKYTRSCISNLLFHFVAERECMFSAKAKRINRCHMLQNLKEIIISEAKSFIRERTLHTELYPELFRVLGYGLRL